MKSALKIDYERGQENYPVIKIVIPNEPNYESPKATGFPVKREDLYEDVRDKLIKDFLHSPLYSEPNWFFSVKTTFPIESGSLTTIGPILEDRLLYVFRHAILNRFVPYDTILNINSENMKTSRPEGKRCMYPKEEIFNKINEFFDWIDNEERATSLEKQPK